MVLPSVYTVRSYTICNSSGWRDDTAKMVRNTEKQRAGSWAILLGEVTSVKLYHVADYCPSFLAILLLDSHHINKNFKLEKKNIGIHESASLPAILFS